MSLSMNVFRLTPYNQQFLFAGKMFKSLINLSIPLATEKDIKIVTGATQIVHVIIRELIVDTSASSGLLDFIESPTVSATGAAYSSFNLNHASLITPTLTLFDCTITPATGTLLEVITLPAGSDPLEQESPELILKPSTTYGIRLLAPNTVPMNIVLTLIWYESNN